MRTVSIACGALAVALLGTLAAPAYADRDRHGKKDDSRGRS